MSPSLQNKHLFFFYFTLPPLKSQSLRAKTALPPSSCPSFFWKGQPLALFPQKIATRQGRKRVSPLLLNCARLTKQGGSPSLLRHSLPAPHLRRRQEKNSPFSFFTDTSRPPSAQLVVLQMRAKPPILKLQPKALIWFATGKRPLLAARKSVHGFFVCHSVCQLVFPELMLDTPLSPLHSHLQCRRSTPRRSNCRFPYLQPAL